MAELFVCLTFDHDNVSAAIARGFTTPTSCREVTSASRQQGVSLTSSKITKSPRPGSSPATQ